MEVHLELLLGRRVLDAGGRPVGRIEEVRAHRRGKECVVEEFHLGPEALAERLAAVGLVSWLLRLLGRKPRRKHPPVPWQDMDLSDPAHPRLRWTLRAR